MLKRKKEKQVAVVPTLKTTADEEYLSKRANELEGRINALNDSLAEMSNDYTILKDGIAELQRKRDLIDKSISTAADNLAERMMQRSGDSLDAAITKVLKSVFDHLIAKPVFETKRFYCAAGDAEFDALLDEGWHIVGMRYDNEKSKLCQIAQRVILPKDEAEFIAAYKGFFAANKTAKTTAKKAKKVKITKVK